MISDFVFLNLEPSGFRILGFSNFRDVRPSPAPASHVIRCVLVGGGRAARAALHHVCPRAPVPKKLARKGLCGMDGGMRPPRLRRWWRMKASMVAHPWWLIHG